MCTRSMLLWDMAINHIKLNPWAKNALNLTIGFLVMPILNTQSRAPTFARNELTLSFARLSSRPQVTWQGCFVGRHLFRSPSGLT